MPQTLLIKTCQPPVGHTIVLSDASQAAVLEKLNNLTHYVKFYFLRVGVNFSCDLSQFPRRITLGFIDLAAPDPTLAAADPAIFTRPVLTEDLDGQFISDHNSLATQNRLSAVTGFSLERPPTSIMARIDDVEQLYNQFLALNYRVFSDLSENQVLALNIFMQQFATNIKLLKNPGIFSSARRIFVPPAFSTPAIGWGEAVGNALKRAASSSGYQLGYNTLAELFDLFIADQKRPVEDRMYYRQVISRILDKTYRADAVRSITSDDDGSDAAVSPRRSIGARVAAAAADTISSPLPPVAAADTTNGSASPDAISSPLPPAAAADTTNGSASPDAISSPLPPAAAADTTNGSIISRPLPPPAAAVPASSIVAGSDAVPSTLAASPLAAASVSDASRELVASSASDLAPERQPVPKSKFSSLMTFIYHRSGTAWLLNQPAYVKYPVIAIVATGAAAALYKFAGSESARRLRNFVYDLFGDSASPPIDVDVAVDRQPFGSPFTDTPGIRLGLPAPSTATAQGVAVAPVAAEVMPPVSAPIRRAVTTHSRTPSASSIVDSAASATGGTRAPVRALRASRTIRPVDVGAVVKDLPRGPTSTL